MYAYSHRCRFVSSETQTLEKGLHVIQQLRCSQECLPRRRIYWMQTGRRIAHPMLSSYPCNPVPSCRTVQYIKQASSFSHVAGEASHNSAGKAIVTLSDMARGASCPQSAHCGGCSTARPAFVSNIHHVVLPPHTLYPRHCDRPRSHRMVYDAQGP